MIDMKSEKVGMMFAENLVSLRKVNGMSQEELAEKVSVSRQTLSKWETGESIPDLAKGKQLAEIFGISLDELMEERSEMPLLPAAPKGKHIFGIVKVGEKGQIVLPARCRRLFEIEAGDRMIVLGDEDRGIAILKEKDFFQLANLIARLDREN